MGSPVEPCALCGLADETNRVCEAWSAFVGAKDVLCRRHELEVHAEIRAVPGAPPPDGDP